MGSEKGELGRGFFSGFILILWPRESSPETKGFPSEYGDTCPTSKMLLGF
jgi:hypothetical protein